MKKTLIALAALAATSAFAQSSVTMYGRLDAGYAHSKTTTETNTAGFISTREQLNNGVTSHNSVSSFWGIKGSEDLGGGMKAEFKLEADVFTANGNTGFSGAAGGVNSSGAFDRISLVGASGGFGSVMFGRDYTPTFYLVAASDVFGLSRLSAVNLAGTTGASQPSQIIYTTPNFGGFSAKASLSRDNDSLYQSGVLGGENSAKNWHLTGTYAQGPLMVGLGFGKMETTTAVNVTNDVAVLTASYDLGVAKLVAGYINGKNSTAGIGGELNQKEFNFGVAVPMGAVTLLGQVGRNTVTDNRGGAVLDRSGTDWVIGADYALSKRTALFVKTGVVNKLSGTTAINTSVDGKMTETNFGVKHTF